MVVYVLGLELQINILMKKLLLLLFIIVSLIGCTRNVSNKSLSFEEYQELLKQTVFVIPDSLKTKEQLQLNMKIYDFFNQYIYVENNCVKLSVGKESSTKEGIPAIYYDVIQYQLEENNECVKKWIESGDIPAKHLDMDSLVREYLVRYKEIDRPKLLKRLEAK